MDRVWCGSREDRMQYSDFHRIVIAFILAAARVGGALAICPATSSSMITGVARNAATLSFAALLVPCVLRWMPPLWQRI